MSKKSLLAIGTLTATIAPIATVISCGDESNSSDHTDIGFVVTPDGTINDGFFKSMWTPIKMAQAKTGKSANYIDVSQKGRQHTVDAVNTLVENGASLVFQPGFMNSETILDNALAHPGVKFLGVSYTKFVASTKAFTDVDHVSDNMGKFSGANNLGLIHFKTHQQGFLDGYLATAKYFTDHASDGASNSNPVKFSAVSSKAYQDTTALMDGFLAGVKAYADANHKHVELVTPLANGSFYTNVTVENSNFASTMTMVQQRLSAQHVKILFVGDPNAIAPFHGHGFVMASDGNDFHKTFDDIVVSSDKNWSSIFTNAINTAYQKGDAFKTGYHDSMHLASYGNGELIITNSHSYPDSAMNPARTAMTAWEASIKAALADENTHSIYEDKDANGNETANGTSKGLEWASALVS